MVDWQATSGRMSYSVHQALCGYISWGDAPKFRCPGLPGSGNDSRMGMSIQTARLPIYGFDDTINSAQTSLVSRGVG